MTVRWDCCAFDALTLTELYDLMALRQRVFIVEQACPYLDADGYDLQAEHLLGRDEADRLVACARLFGPGIKYAESSIGRVVTAPEVRGTGLGQVLMAEALARLERLDPGGPVRIGAQLYLERFYGGFGFERTSEPYDEDGILHIEMRRSGK